MTTTTPVRDEKQSFVHQIQSLIEWVDGAATLLTKEEILDSLRVRVLVLAKKFIAFPHCENFSLMPAPSSLSEQI
jgi:hypothetical protein